jgi:hypothetical protein
MKTQNPVCRLSGSNIRPPTLTELIPRALGRHRDRLNSVHFTDGVFYFLHSSNNGGALKSQTETAERKLQSPTNGSWVNTRRNQEKKNDCQPTKCFEFPSLKGKAVKQKLLFLVCNKQHRNSWNTKNIFIGRNKQKSTLCGDNCPPAGGCFHFRRNYIKIRRT